MVHTSHPVWGNRSCLRFGIYSEALDEEESTNNNRRFRSKRLRYCVVIGMVGVSTLLVGLMVYDMISGYGAPTREKDALQHLLKLRRTTEATPYLNTTIASTFPTTTAKTSTTPSHTTHAGENEKITTTENAASITQSSEESLQYSVQPLDSPADVLSDYTYQNVSIQGDEIEEEIVESSREVSEALPYRYVSEPESSAETSFSSRKHGKQRTSEPYTLLKQVMRNKNPSRRDEGYSSITYGKDDYPVYLIPSTILRAEPAVQSRIMNHVKHQVPRPFRAKNFTSERQQHNRIKVFRNDPQAVLPYYGFTSSNKYPQLSSYRYPNEAKNIQDIIKYLSAGDSSTNPKHKQQETVAIRQPASNSRRIKFAGVYKTAEKEDSSEKYNKPGESMESFSVSDQQNKVTDSSSLNGHAYISDPFHAFKPSDPAEINLLASSNFRFAPADNHIRFINNRPHGTRWGAFEINPNEKYFPRPPINFGKPLSTSTEDNDNNVPTVQMYPGTYTSAIYRPFGKEPSTKESSILTTGKTSKKAKPFSVMLDIYPMMEDAVPQATSGFNKHLPLRPFVRPGHAVGQNVRFPPNEHRGKFSDHVTDSETKHQMIVHLNLYPKKKNNFSSRKDDDIHSFHVDVKSNPYCCGEGSAENTERIYEIDDEEEEELDTNSNFENNENEAYKDILPWKLSQLIHKQKSIDFLEPRGIISGQGSEVAEVTNEEDSVPQEQSVVYESATGQDISQQLTNHRMDKDFYTPLDVRLTPSDNTSASLPEAGVQIKDSEDNKNVDNTKDRSDKINLETTPFLFRSGG